ncbi:MAG: DUF5696 domain-containing protein [Bacillota bacterium]|nr:DUF5696 domain-containing protein [Bacillota bacterium]
MKAICFCGNVIVKEFDTDISTVENEISVKIKKEQLSKKGYDVIRISDTLTKAKAGDDGYMFFPTNCSCGVSLCYFTQRDNAVFTSLVSAMPVCGIGGNENAILIIVKGMACDVRFRVENNNGEYSISPEFVLDGDEPYEDIELTYYKMPNSTYSDMGRIYRKYQLEEKNCIPIRERIKTNEYLKYAAESMEVRIRMGWKPVPTPVMHQNPENEPPLKVVCDLEKLNAIVGQMQVQGIEKAELCLVGWGEGGHDGRFPQQIPSDPRYGGDDELKAFIKKAQKLGYNVVCHTNSVCAYEVADNWDKEALTKQKDEHGNIEPMVRKGYVNSGGLSGGAPWHMCARSAYEKYAVIDLPKVAEYGFRGLHFVDELTACEPVKCYDENHPVTRKDAVKYYRKIAQLSKQLFGGFQSEAWLDFLNADVDYIMYTTFNSKLTHKLNPLFDEGIPFWQIVYHGIVLSNFSSETVNYPLKDNYQQLKFLEYGSRPLMYFYSKFGEGKNWMGDIDLTCASDEEIKTSVAAMKIAYDDYERLNYLQYEFMDNHEKLSDNVYRITYSDGTKITVDYNCGEYKIEK